MRPLTASSQSLGKLGFNPLPASRKGRSVSRSFVLNFRFGPLDIERHNQISGNFTSSKSFHPDTCDLNS
jgi:hypothetical protein